MPSPAETHTPSTLTVDRIACTGHGVCASLLPEHVALDEWAYPVVPAAVVDPEMGDVAIRLCPARALAWAPRR
jgi:ferredoxin